MAKDKPISGLASYPSWSASDIIEVVKGGGNYQMPLQTILDNVPTSGGGTGTPGGTNGQIQYNSSGSFGGLGEGTAGQTLLSAGTATPPAWGYPRTPVFSVTGIGSNVVNTTTPTSIFTGSTIGLGSLTIPANRLRLGSSIGLFLHGDWDGSGASPTITFILSLGGTTFLTGTTGALGNFAGKQWKIYSFYTGVTAGGSSGTVTGDAVISGNASAANASWATYMTTGGSGTASTPVVLNLTTALPFDLTVTWSAASASNRIRLLGGSMWIDG